MDFPKIAFRADSPVTLSRAIQIAQTEKCTAIYIVGNNRERVAGLRAAGITVKQVLTKEKLPKNVFQFIPHKGYWAVVNRKTNEVRDVTWAEHSLQAAQLILRRIKPEDRKKYMMVPVALTALDLF